MKKSELLQLTVLIAAAIFAGCKSGGPSPFSKEAEAALATFETAPGFKIELVASEPLIKDPVAFSIDEYGKMFVVEMAGMPLNRSGVGRIVLLTDTSHDGKMDKRTVFADSLIMPSGVLCWNKGVIVSDPPNVYFMQDTNNDGIADVKKILLTGFDVSNLEGNINSPIYGPDNWIYLSSLPGIKGGNIHFADDSTSERLPEGSVRFRPDLHLLEPVAGKSQYGHTFDEWGNYFGLNNHYHIYHEVIAARYLKRNPDLVAPRATQLLPEHSRVFSITKNPEYQMLTEIGEFTSACGLTSYLGGEFPEEYNSNVTFVGEPASNIVHVDKLSDSGVTYTAKRISETKEFIASTDPYSRMVNMSVGPDGALYIADFYRQVIEGPEFMSEEVLKKTNLYNGNDKGRIYRVTRSDAGTADWPGRLKLGEAPTEELVKNLANKNIWWRINSQRLIVERQDKAAIPLLIKTAHESPSAMGRLHALWTLQGLDALKPDLIHIALKDSIAGMRINGIRLAELHLEEDNTLATQLLTMGADPDIKVRYQLVCALGFLKSAEADQLRLQLLFRDISDRWVQIAALSAASSQSVALLNGVIEKYDPSIPAYASLVQLLGAMVGKSQDAAVVKNFIQKSIKDAANGYGQWQSPLLDGLTQGLSHRKVPVQHFSPEQSALITTVLDNPSQKMRSSALNMLKVTGLPDKARLKPAFAHAEKIANDASLDQDRRALAIDFIALSDVRDKIDFLKNLVSPKTAIMVQIAAINALGRVPGLSSSNYFLQQWPSLTPELKSTAIQTFLSDDERIKLLLDKVEAGEINKGAIGWGQSVHLRSDGKYRDLARKILTETDAARNEIIGRYTASLKSSGDAAKGKAIFQENCALCHQSGGKYGFALGPDLGTIRAWNNEDILTNILDPNRSIALGFDLWQAKLNNGKSVQGVISSETPTSITLSNIGGVTNSISRDDISSLATMQMSLMPGDFDTKINEQQMADLLAFLRKAE